MKSIRHQRPVYVPVRDEALIAGDVGHVSLAGSRRLHVIVDEVDALRGQQLSLEHMLL